MSYLREGHHTINPYLVAKDAEKTLEFLKSVLGGEVTVRMNAPDGTIMHCEIWVGDMTVELGQGGGAYPPTEMALHVYVPDADAVYAKALEAGVTVLHPMTDQPYGDREGGVKDVSGNHWYIATHKEGGHKPEGLWTVTPYLHVRGADGLIEFMKRAFGASEMEVHRGAEGVVMHAKIRIGDSVVELSESHGEWGPMPANLHLYVPDTDATYARAVEAGATSQSAPADAPYGDRTAGVADAWGNQWWIATYQGG